ncbi:hypothetical protein XA68_15576 [Ophiocordyceps unilateralis]|uniref:FAD-binding PCMH-type domain-containing protein n=1 Tax=Ophiocordyceps unilateralis TaxID=268505 RepID=A0A2A9P6J7_OPHUN|nr:hypothetical protein XA68_15576 [Ophiocordyceps unilateralis]
MLWFLNLLLFFGLALCALPRDHETYLAAAEKACRTALGLLGPKQVKTRPLNQTIVEQNWSLTCVTEPHCIVLPRDAADVAVVMRVIKLNDVVFAVRAAGNSPNPGWSSIDKRGILIDLQRLNQVSVSGDAQRVRVGAGARWGEVMAAANNHHVSVVGTRVSSLSVGGSILGGGYFFVPGYGLAADNVRSVEVVLADGHIVNASCTENKQLLWAIKGGGANFGIVTKFELDTIPIDKIWYEVLALAKDQALDALDALAKWQLQEGSLDTKGNIVFSVSLDAVLLAFIYTEPQVSRPKCFAPFYNLSPARTIVPATNGTFSSLYIIADSTLPKQVMRHDYRGASSLVDAQLYKDVYKFWEAKASTVFNNTGARQTFVMQHVPAFMADYGVVRTGNPLGIPRRTHQWWTTLVDWTRAEDDSEARSVCIETADYWERLSKERRLGVPFLFMNDAGRDQNPIATYGADNFKKLREVSLKYDSTQVFQRLQNDGFLLQKSVAL